MSKNLPILPFSTGDYLNDTSMLSLEEKGAYTEILFQMWEQGGALPNDDRRIARLLRIDVRKWKRLKLVLADFLQTSDGLITNLRLTSELTRAQVRSDQAKLKAACRWNKDSKKPLKNNDGDNAAADAAADATAKPEQCNPKPKPKQRKKDIDKSISKETAKTLEIEIANNFEVFWKAFPFRTAGNKAVKGSKEEALTSYSKHIKANTATFEQLQKAAEDYHQHPDTLRGYARNCSTWLNKLNFNDEIMEVSGHGGTNTKNGKQSAHDKFASAAANFAS